MLLGHRYYDASTGRFLTRDPIKSGSNWYTYCQNNPVEWTDSKGECVFVIIGIVAGVIAIGATIAGVWHHFHHEGVAGENYHRAYINCEAQIEDPNGNPAPGCYSGSANGTLFGALAGAAQLGVDGAGVMYGSDGDPLDAGGEIVGTTVGVEHGGAIVTAPEHAKELWETLHNRGK